MKNLFTRISDPKQIKALEGKPLDDDLEFHFSIFFKSRDYSRESLFRRGLCVIYTDHGMVSCGNYECISDKFSEMKYEEFVDCIKA
jgi:hypothetical protein